LQTKNGHLFDKISIHLRIALHVNPNKFNW